MKPVKVAAIQFKEAGTNIPGVGNLKTVLNSHMYPGIEMTLTPSGVMCEHKGISFFIPLSSCKVLLLGEKASFSEVA